MQTRRHVLAVAGTLLAGCASWTRDRPAPNVGDHLQGDFTVVDTTRRIHLDAPDEVLATVRNDGYDSAVALSLYWVPTPDADPGEKSHRELRAAGYERATERIVSVSSGDRRTVTFEQSVPGDAAGYYVRYHVLTYGARVTKKGAPGSVRVILVDTPTCETSAPWPAKRCDSTPASGGSSRSVRGPASRRSGSMPNLSRAGAIPTTGRPTRRAPD